MKIFITGISSFIGSHLARHFLEKGFYVSGTIRRKTTGKSSLPASVTIFPYELNGPFDSSVLSHVDAIIHMIHDFTKEAKNKNIEGTKKVALAGVQAGVKRQIFISSYSARPDAVTEYGQTKFALELFFQEIGGTSIRPGLVIGDGGVFERICGLVRRFPIVPLLDGGHGQIPIVGVDNLAEAVHSIVSGGKPVGIYNFFNTQHVSLKEMTLQIMEHLKKRRFLISVPSSLLLVPLTLLNKMGIPLPVDINNLRAFRHNQSTDYPSHLSDFIHREDHFTEMLQKITQ